MSTQRRVIIAVLVIIPLGILSALGAFLSSGSSQVQSSSTPIPRTAIGLSQNRGPSGYPVVTSPSTKAPASAQTAVSSAPAHQGASTAVNTSSTPSSLPTSGASANPQQPIPAPTGGARTANSPTAVPVPTSAAPKPSESVSVAPTTPAPTQTTPSDVPTTPAPSPTETTPTAVPTTPSPTQTTPTAPAPEAICTPFAQQTNNFLGLLGNGQNPGNVSASVTYYQNELQLDIHSIYLSDPASPVYGDLLNLSNVVSVFRAGDSLSSLTSSIATVESDC